MSEQDSVTVLIDEVGKELAELHKLVDSLESGDLDREQILKVIQQCSQVASDAGSKLDRALAVSRSNEAH